MFELRPYQKEAVQAVTEQWDQGCRKTLLVLATGLGKTVCFLQLTKDAIDRGGRVLILAHRGELLDQASDKLQSFFQISSNLEKAQNYAIGRPERVTVGSVQTLGTAKRLNRFPRNYYSHIIIDEAHHCLSDSYRKILNYFDEANVLGVTATPDRGDHKNLGEYFDSKAYEYGMAKAIREGYLSPIKAKMIPIKLDLTNVKISSGDYSANEVGDALDPYLERIADEMVKECSNRKTVVFLPLVSTSQRFAELLNEKGLSAVEVNGNSGNRAEILKDFEDGKYNVLCNSMLLTEGWDCPSVDCIVVLRPTKVRGLYQQMVGRGTRLFPGKDHLLLLDFLWMTDRHDLCKPSSLVSKDAKIAEKVNRKFENSYEAFDLIEADEEAQKDVVSEREQVLAEELYKMRMKKRSLVDPIQYAVSIAAEDLSEYEPTFGWEFEPATEAQLAFLEKRGIFTGAIENRGMAKMIIEKLIDRQVAGLATPKQIRLLERYGFDHVGRWSFESASGVISVLAKRQWILPQSFDPKKYIPKEC